MPGREGFYARRRKVYVLAIELISIAVLIMALLALRKEESVLKAESMPRGKIERFWGGAERRRFVRFVKLLEVRYSLRSKVGKNSGKMSDLSEGGIRMLVDKKLERGERLDIEILYEQSGQPVRVEGVIVWCNEAKDKEKEGDKRFFHAGVKFSKRGKDSRSGFESLVEYTENTALGRAA